MLIKIKIHVGVIWALLYVISSVRGQIDFVPINSKNPIPNSQKQLTKYRYDMLNRVREMEGSRLNRFRNLGTYYYDNRPYFVQPTKGELYKNQYYNYIVTSDKQSNADKVQVKTAASSNVNSKSSDRNEDVTMKMKALESVLDDDEKGCGESETLHSLHEEMKLSPYMTNETKRIARQVKKQRPGFFWTLIRVTFEVSISKKSRKRKKKK